jgi:hypothetical protein
MKNSSRDFVTDKTVVPNIKKLLSIIATYPVTSADCERGFSTMNDICTKTRNSLDIENVSDLLFLSLVGPPVAMFDPEDYVKEWLKRNHRSADDNRSRKVGLKHSERYSNLWHLF